MLDQNYFAKPNFACFDFSSSRLNLQGHILCTTGDDLRVMLTLEVTHKVSITFNEGSSLPLRAPCLLKVKDLTKTFFTGKKKPHIQIHQELTFRML